MTVSKLMINKLTLKSYAKVNLYLEVLSKRKDGYHDISTIFERIGLADKVTLKNRKDGLTVIFCSDPAVPKDFSNLCWKAAESLRRRSGLKKGLDIRIEKRIPVGAGLGGGSSNAAAVLTGLNRLWKLKIPEEKLARLGGGIGSDVPFFIYNTPFAEGRERGNVIRPLNKLKGLRFWHILVVPKIHVSTPLIYKKWDDFCGLTTPVLGVKLLIPAISKKGFRPQRSTFFNGLEVVTERLYPEVRRIKEKLLSLGVSPVLMSGSGPAVFGIVPSRKEAVSLSRKLNKHNNSWRVFIVKTV